MPLASMNPSLTRFLDAFWQDVAKRTPRSLDDYLGEFSECGEQVRSEYLRAFGERAASTDMAGNAGQRIVGRYEVLGEVERGGQGVIILCHDPFLDRKVVIKTLPHMRAASHRQRERLQREARLAGRIEDRGVCPILDVAVEGGEVYVIMPFLEGGTLDDRIRAARSSGAGISALWASLARLGTGDSPAGQFLTDSDGDVRYPTELIERIARTLHVVHERGILHRDIKPSNIMFQRDGEPVIVDFGLALDTSASERISISGHFMGTPGYAAPEQAEARSRDVDRRTDVYSLGVVLYECLTLELPFRGSTAIELLRRMAGGDPRPLRSLNPAIPRDLESVCMKAIACAPERRYASALEFADDLRNFRVYRPVNAKPVRRLRLALRRATRNRPLLAAVAVALVMAAVLAWQLADRNYYVRARLAVSNILESGAVDEEGLRYLRGLLDEREYALLLAEPSAPESWELIEREYKELLTRTDGAGLALYLRGNTTASQPVFRFALPVAEQRRQTVRVEVGGTARFVIDGGPMPASPATEMAVACDRQLAPGEYQWTVRADGLEWQSARLVVRTAAELDDVIAPIPSVIDEDLDRLVQCCALLRADYGVAALERLDAVTPPSRRKYDLRWRFLRAQALYLLGQEERYMDLMMDLLRAPRRK